MGKKKMTDLLGFKSSKKRKKGICFSPAPLVHEFDCSSPTVRRLDLKSSRKSLAQLERQDSDALLVEMKMQDVDTQNKHQLLEKWNQELRDELFKGYGLNATGTNEELNDRLDLAKILMRRAHLRVSGDRLLSAKNGEEAASMPIDLSTKQLKIELENRKIVVKEESRKAKIAALEEALLKEIEPLVGGGYDFGRRFVSVEDFIETKMELNELSDEALDDELKSRGVTKLPKTKVGKQRKFAKILENEVRQGFHNGFRVEVVDEIKRRGLIEKCFFDQIDLVPQKLDFNSPMLQNDDEIEPKLSSSSSSSSSSSTTFADTMNQVPKTATRSKKRKLESSSDEQEKTGANYEVGIETPPATKRVKRISSSDDQGQQMEEEAVNRLQSDHEKFPLDHLFGVLFVSGAWRKDYDEPKYPLEPSACAIS